MLSNFLHTSGVTKGKRNNDHEAERKRQEVARKWSAVSEEANEFVYLNEKTPSSSFRGAKTIFHSGIYYSIYNFIHQGVLHMQSMGSALVIFHICEFMLSLPVKFR